MSRKANRPPNPANLSELEADCRNLLGRLAHGRGAREYAWSRDVIETLEGLDLVVCTATYGNGEGSYQAKPRALGYCHDLKTFTI